MSQLISHGSVGDFLEKNRSYLLKREAQNNLILGICENLKQKPRNELDHFLSVEYNGEIMAVLIKTSPKAVLSATTYQEKDILLLCRYFEAKDDKPVAVLAETLYADLFARSFNEVSRVKTRLMLHQLTEKPESRDTFQKFGAAGEGDIDQLSNFLLAYEFDTEHVSRLDISTARTIVKQQVDEHRLFVWRDAGAIVSMAAILRRTPNFCAIGNVYTPGNLRGKGYGRSCVNELSRYVIDQGYAGCVLFSDLSNPVSGHIYNEIGYRPVSEFCEVSFNQQDAF